MLSERSFATSNALCTLDTESASVAMVSHWGFVKEWVCERKGAGEQEGQKMYSWHSAMYEATVNIAVK